MQQPNQFIKGLMSDIDVSKRTSDMWTFPSMNIRIINKTGQGFIVTYTEGNTKVDSQGNVISNGEEFTLTSGFKVLGACEYNGVLYISSYNATTLQGEIGCFPSPNTLALATPNSSSATPVFQRIYRPLRNYTNGVDFNAGGNDPHTIVRNPLKTTLFNWDLELFVDMFAAESYDGSLDLFLCDYKNPNRVFNTTFHNNTGVVNDRLYWDNDFYGSVNQVQSSFADMTAEFVDLPTGGSNHCGIYFLYFRYSDGALNTSPFVLESGPVQVYQGDTNTLYTVQGGEDTKSSQKQIHFLLHNVDQTFQYIEVAFIRYYSDSSGVQIHETWLVDWKFPITNSDVDILITGNEALLTITDAEIIERTLIERTCRSHTQLGNRYWGGNWKASQKNHKGLIEFFKRVKVSYDDSTAKDCSAPLGPNQSGLSEDWMQYQDFYLTYDDVGYFRGEPYAFAGVCRLNDMQYTDAYPLRGCDQYENDVLSSWNDNDKGVYRFPRAKHSNPFTGGKIYVLKVTMDFTDAIGWLINNPNSADVQWIKSNVHSIFFVRAERTPTLKTQGLAISACRSYDNNTSWGSQIAFNCSYNANTVQPMHAVWDTAITPSQGIDLYTHLSEQPGLGTTVGQAFIKSTGAGNATNTPWKQFCDAGTNVAANVTNPLTYQSKVIPIYRGYMPMMYYHSVGDHNFRYNLSRWWPVPHKYGIFSFDYMFDNHFDSADIISIQRVGRTVYSMGGNQVDNWYRYGLNGITGFSDIVPYETVNEHSDTYYIDRATGTPDNDSSIVGKEELGKGLANDHTPYNPTALNFVNQASDLGDSANGYGNCLCYAANGTENKSWSNRNIYIAPFISIEEDKDNIHHPESYNLDIVNLYSKRPSVLRSNAPSNNLVNHYSIGPQTQYFKISESIRFDISDTVNFGLINSITGTPIHILGRGDCFLQKTFFKHTTWKASEWKDDMADPLGIGITSGGATVWDSSGPVWDEDGDINDPVRYAHGVILGVVTENYVNTAMRHKDTNYANVATFYPYTNSVGWAIYPVAYEGIESFAYNQGYHRQLSTDIFLGVNISLPALANLIRKTRIRYSPIKIPYAYTDNYRNLQPTDYEDFDLQFGQIIAIEFIEDDLISIQESAINQHSINEEALKSATTAGDLTLGLGPILSKKVNVLAYWGTQHQWSVCKGYLGIYGWDWKERIHWRVKAGQTAIGTKSMGCENLTATKLIEKWIFDLSDTIEKRTDIINYLADTPPAGEGLVTGYDPRNRDILFTVLKRIITGYTYSELPKDMSAEMYAELQSKGLDWLQNIPVINMQSGLVIDKGQVVYSRGKIYYNDSHSRGDIENIRTWMISEQLYEDYSHTIAFNEDLDFYTSEYSFYPYWYGYINRDFFSAISNRIYLHNQEPICTFYNTFTPAEVSVIVNGNLGETAGNYSMISKLYTWVNVEAQASPFSQVTYETTYQTGVHNGDTSDDFQTTTEFWRNPIHHEHKWSFPVQVQTSANSDEFNQGSEMRGEWMKITLKYAKTVQGWIKNIITTFIGSNS